MNLILRLAAKSLRSRVLTTWLTVTSIALSVTLLVGIEHLRAGVRESFTGTIRGTDLIVGARGGSLQVLLSSVFGIGSPAGSVSVKTFNRWKAHPAVKWAVPYTLGDSHRGFRVVGTTAEFYDRYRFRKDGRVTFVQGKAAVGDDEVVIGSEVAEKLHYELGAPVVVTHGLQDIGTSNHEAHPFHVIGILGRTFTPIDRSVYLTLEGIEAMHVDEPGRIKPAIEATNTGAATEKIGLKVMGKTQLKSEATPPPMPGATLPAPATTKKTVVSSDAAGSRGGAGNTKRGAEQATAASIGLHDDDQITAFFVGTKNRFEALQLQREMNTDFTEPLTAVIPGVALGELFNSIGSAEVGLRVVALFAVAIGLTGMLVALYSSLDARRREMAILRSVGAGPGTIVALLVIESGLLALLGCIIGVVLVYVGLLLGQGPIEQRFGLHIPIGALQGPEFQYLALILFAGIAVGFVPAFKAYRTSLADGLSPRA
ncbi:MAG: ABC transporter permease [Gemmatimonadaceae bacterium]